MLKVKNKKVIDEIAGTTYRANKKRNLLTIFAIALTTFLIAVVLAVGVSYWNTISERQIRMQGMDYDIELSEPREEQVEKIRSMEQIVYAGVAVKCAVLEQYEDTLLDKTRLYWLDETCWEKQTVPALESYVGAYPQKEEELMLSASTLKAMGIQSPKIGMKLSMTYFTLAEDSADQDPLEKEFVLCGWYTDYSGSQRGYVSQKFFESTGVKQTDFTQGTLKMTLKNPLYTKENIIDLQNAIGMERSQFISADYDTISNFCRIVLVLAAMLLMVFASGYLFIYNTLYLSISKDIRYYGQLKTIGMTSVQLKRIVYRQALWNAAIGIPIGLITAMGIANLVIPKLIAMVNPSFSAGEISPVNLWAFLIAGCFAFLTNLFSCRKPAKIAGDCSPIEAVRYIPVTGKGKRRKREGGSVASMAFQNMFRDKKQAAVILTSFVIAISIFLVVNAVIRGNDARLILNEVYSYDIRFKNETTLEEDRRQLIDAEKLLQLEAVEGVKSIRKVTSTVAVVPYQEDVFGTYYRELYQSRYSPGNYEEDMDLYKSDPDNGFFTSRLISVDEEGFALLNESLGNVLDEDAFERGEIAVAIKSLDVTEGDAEITGKTVSFYLPDGDNPGKEHQILIAAVGDTYCNPAYFAGGYTPELIVSESYARELIEEPFTELVCVEYEDPFSKETEQKVNAIFQDEKQISRESKLDRYDEMKASENQVRILGGSMGVIIAMLAILNYLNMMAASVQNRAKEFAILESIGMTTKQIQNMLRIEGLGYGGISICLSLLAGLPASFAVFNAVKLYRIEFSVPWFSNLILFGVILALCVSMPVLLYERTRTDSIIERLRDGEE